MIGAQLGPYRRLDHLVENAPPEARVPMLRNVRLHREIRRAAGDAATVG